MELVDEVLSEQHALKHSERIKYQHFVVFHFSYIYSLEKRNKEPD